MECARNGTSAPVTTCSQVRAKHSNFCLIYHVKSSQKKRIQILFFTSFLCCCLKDPTWNFLQCVGLPSTDTGRDHIHRLKQILEATMDVYTFMVRVWIKDNGMNALKNCRITSQGGLLLIDNMKWGSSCFMETISVLLDVLHRLIFPWQKSSMKRVPILSLKGALHLNPRVDPYQSEAVVQMWMEVKIKPLLHSITKNFLSCLSTKNFSCSTYQTMYIRAREALVVARYARLSHPCPLLQGEGAKPPFLWDESSQTEVDLHLLYVPFSVWRQNRW